MSTLAEKPGTRAEVAPPERSRAWPLLMVMLLAAVINTLVMAKLSIPVLRPAAGFVYIFALPVYLLYTMSLWRHCAPQERLAYSVATTLLVLMLGGLGVNTILPLVDIKRPLDADGILVFVDLVNVSFYAVRERYPKKIRWRPGLASVGREELRLMTMASLSVILVILGANRLNNGAGGQLTLIALAVIAILLLFTLRWMRSVRDAALSVIIYLASLSLLLSTSLRGWYVSGHDIQEEYSVFQLTATNSRWSMSYWHDAYDACLSITILPTELSRMIDVSNPYVFKLFFQMIFAFCPIFVYAMGRRYFSRTIALLSVVYFIGFPTFFTDMPFLNRQEIGLLFVVAGALAATNTAWSRRGRQIGLVVSGVGVEVSHYSSMYVLIGILAVGWACRYATHRLTRKDRAGRRGPDQKAAEVSTGITLVAIIALAGIVLLWGGLITGTAGQVLQAGEAAVSGLTGHSSSRSGNVSFSLLGGSTRSPSEVLQQYRHSTMKTTAVQPTSLYLPRSAVLRAATPYVPQQLLPLTELGHLVNDLGVPVTSLSALIRNLIAYCEQLFLIVGLVRLFVLRRRQRQPVTQDFFWLAIGSVGVLALITFLPSVSADYGILRAFEQGLIFLGPVVVVGSATIFYPLGKWRAQAASAIICLGLFINTSGLVPQLLGANAAQLNLNNNGIYYDLYYMRSQDASAVAWLENQPYVNSYPIQSSYIQTKYLFTSPERIYGTQAITDAYPTLVRRTSWVILGYPIIDSDLAYTFTRFNGDLIEYRYPLSLLSKYKNLVYTNGNTAVYK